jgi:hypothetical protein
MRHGLIAVRYVGSEMTVLHQCRVYGKYRYVGGTRKEDEVTINDEDSLHANLPVGAAKLEGQLQRSGKLTVKMSIVGRYEAEKAIVSGDDLAGDCTGATHFVLAVTVGAFDFYAGADATVSGAAGIGSAGAGGQSAASRATIEKDGDVDACRQATPSDVGPPAQCGAPVRLEVAPLAPSITGAESAPIPVPSSDEGKPDAAESGTTQRTIALVTGVAGVASIGIGGALALAAKSKDNTAQGEPLPARQTDSQSAVSQGNVATALVGVGLGGVAAGLVLWLTAPRSNPSVATDGRTLLLHGTF